MSAQLSVGASVGGRFEIRDLIEAAPGYTAYRAHDHASAASVTLWWMRPELYPDEERRAGFIRAANILASVEHPQVRRVLAAGREQGGLYAVVQPGSGGLRARLRRGAAPDEEVAWLATEIAEALEAVHELGLYHGRLVPSDVVEHAGLIKVGSVGLFAGVDAEAAAALWIRHERYVAPEVRRGAAPTSAADVYSLSVLLVELAAGVIGTEIERVAATVAERRGDLIEALAPGLASGPEQRPPTPRALVERIARAIGQDVGAARAPRPEREQRWREDDDELETVLLERSQRSRRSTARDTAEEPARELPLKAGANPPSAEAPAPAAPAATERAATENLSRRTPRPTPILPIGERGGKKPVIRSLAEFHQPPAPGPLGHYAPPRTTPATPRRRLGLIYALVAAIAAGATAALVWGLLQRLSGGRRAGETAPAAGASAAAGGGVNGGRAGKAAPGPVAGAAPGRGAAAPRACPRGMVLVPAQQVCIDAFESPGKGKLPATGIGILAAQATCRRRGARLCTQAEWEAACRGPGGADFPYGSGYRSEPCNTDPQRAGAVTVAGSFPGCVSAVGAYDMSGNVAEWTAGGAIMGGSALDESRGRCDAARAAVDPGRSYPDVGFRCCAAPR